MKIMKSILRRRTFLTGAFAAGLAAAAPFGTASAQEPIKVGLVAALSGQSAKSGEAITRGLSIAIDEINAAGGINGRKIQWVFYDAETQASKAVLATRRLIESDKVDIIVGGGNASGLAMQFAPDESFEGPAIFPSVGAGGGCACRKCRPRCPSPASRSCWAKAAWCAPVRPGICRRTPWSSALRTASMPMR